MQKLGFNVGSGGRKFITIPQDLKMDPKFMSPKLSKIFLNMLISADFGTHYHTVASDALGALLGTTSPPVKKEIKKRKSEPSHGMELRKRTMMTKKSGV